MLAVARALEVELGASAPADNVPYPIAEFTLSGSEKLLAAAVAVSTVAVACGVKQGAPPFARGSANKKRGGVI